MEFITSVFEEAYRIAGITGVIAVIFVGAIIIIGIIMYRYTQSVINRRNASSADMAANSVAVEVTAKLAHESSTDLRVTRQIIDKLRDDNARLTSQLADEKHLVTLSENDLADCVVRSNKLAELLIKNGIEFDL